MQNMALRVLSFLALAATAGASLHLQPRDSLSTVYTTTTVTSTVVVPPPLAAYSTTTQVVYVTKPATIASNDGVLAPTSTFSNPSAPLIHTSSLPTIDLSNLWGPQNGSNPLTGPQIPHRATKFWPHTSSTNPQPPTPTQPPTASSTTSTTQTITVTPVPAMLHQREPPSSTAPSRLSDVNTIASGVNLMQHDGGSVLWGGSGGGGVASKGAKGAVGTAVVVLGHACLVSVWLMVEAVGVGYARF